MKVRFQMRVKVKEENPHASDCSFWVNEECDCLTNPDGKKAQGFE